MEEMTNDERYELFVTRMEREVVSLLALDEKAATKFTGRADGPKFAQENALKNEQGSARRTTPVSRAWRRTTGWLDDLLNTSRVVAREVAIQKLLTYHHPSPSHLKATPEQIESRVD